MSRKPVRTLFNWFLIAAGFLSIALGVIGIFLPLLPTTPFLLLAAICFSKGSERWHAWLLSQPHLGKAIRDWNEHGVIRTRVKVVCISMMAATLAYSLFMASFPIYGRLTLVAISLWVSIFVGTRPSQARQVKGV